MAESILRLQVTLQNDENDVVQVVLPVEVIAGTTTVREIQFQIEQSLADLGIDDGLGEIRLCTNTSRGYLLRGSDLASHVLREDDAILAVSRSAWLSTQLPLCTTTLYNLSKMDLALNKALFVEIGITSRNRLFLICGWGRGGRGQRTKVERFRILDDDSQLTSNQTSVLMTANGEEWMLAVSKLGPNTLELSNKPSHAAEPTTVKLRIDYVDGKLKLDTKAINLTDPDAIDQAYLATTPALPADETSGPTIPPVSADDSKNDTTSKPIVPEVKASDAWPNESWLVSLVKPDDGIPPLEIYQDILRLSGGNVLSQFVALNLEILNRLEKSTLQIEDVSASIGGKKTHTFKGMRSARCRYNTQVERGFQVEPRSREKIAFVNRLDIPIDDNTHLWNQFRRLHRSLLDAPPTLSITFKTFDGDTCTLTIPLPVGEEIVHPTKANCLKSFSQEENDLLAFVTCDDTDTESRLVWACAVAKDRHGQFLKCTRSPHRSGQSSGGSVFIRADMLAKIAYDATKANKSEFPIDSLKYKDNAVEAGTCSVEVLALIHGRRVYAFRVILSTNTGSTSHAFRLPPIN